jgi:hypothetical protein
VHPKEITNLGFLPFIILLLMASIYSISVMDGKYERAHLNDLETSPTRPLAIGFLKFFQEYISPTDDSRCALYPTCAEYSLQAIKKHGLPRGVVMTFDRLLHEPDEKRIRPAEFIKGAYRVRDPLSENELTALPK